MGGEGSGGHEESGAVRLELDQGRVVINCRNIKCQATLAVGAPTHRITVNPSGVNVEPEFSCGDCGLIMRVHRNEVIATGWVKKRAPRSEIIVMPTKEDRERPAVRIERPRAVEFIEPPQPEPEPEVVSEPDPIEAWGDVDIFAPLEVSKPEKKRRAK